MIPEWLTLALTELDRGVAEVAGPKANPRIAEYLNGVRLPADDEIPWCAAFVGWCLQQSGVKPTGAPNARSYLEWGQPTSARPGAIAVLWRSNPSAWTGHVGFLLDESPGTIFLLGGNQTNRVSVAAFPKERVLRYRWPSS